MQAIVRVRLAPWVRCQAFEQWLRAIPAVLYAALVTGEADYELRVDCPASLTLATRSPASVSAGASNWSRPRSSFTKSRDFARAEPLSRKG